MTQQLEYPPKSWTCKSCGKHHSKPHFAFPDQIDEKKKPGDYGRIKFGREAKDETNTNNLGEKSDCKRSDMETGPQFEVDDCNNLVQKPLICPHCGFVDDVQNIVKTK